MQLKEALKLFIYICISTLLFSQSSVASQRVLPLPADEAFVFTTTINRTNEVLVEWHIAPGYYLYAKRMHISFMPKTATNIHFPAGKLKYGVNQSQYEIFSGVISIPILLQTKDQNLQLNVDYQGCSEDGFCYPPIHKNIMLNLLDKSAQTRDNAMTVTHENTSIKSLLTNQNGVQAVLHTQHIGLILLIFVCLGMLLALTPCVWPMVPILTGIIVGQKQSVGTKKAFLLSCTYVLGSAVIYAFAGMMAALMGSSLQVILQQPWVIVMTSGIFVLLALSLFGMYELQLPHRFQNRIMQVSQKQKGGTLLSVFLMGMLSTLIVSPCVTAPLIGVLMYISETGNLILGASALFVMGLGMGIPLILIGLSAGKWLPKSGAWMEAVKKSVGLLMLGMTIWLLSRVISPHWTHLLWGLFLFGSAIFLGVYLPQLLGARSWYRGLGLLVGCSGMLLVVSGINMPNFVSKLIDVSHTTVINHSFVVVHNLNDLNQQLVQAQLSHKPVILDFYADWCESCVAMDKNVFSTSNVKQVLTNYILLRADLSANTTADEIMLKHFDVIAPPTVLFFDGNGHESNSQRIIGEVDAKEFLSRLNLFMATSCDKNVKC